MFIPDDILKETQQELSNVISRLGHEKDKLEYKKLTNQLQCLNAIINNLLKYKSFEMK
jgi:hypothetical protein